MATAAIKLESPTTIVAAPSTIPPQFQPVAPVQMAPAPTFASPRSRPSAFYTPSNWHIENKGAVVLFTNNSTGDTFEGTQKEFSAYLRNT